MISHPHELHRFLATPGMEFVNLMFASNDVVWVSWRFIADERIPSYIIQTRSSKHTSLLALACSCLVSRQNARSRDLFRHSVIFIQQKDEASLVKTGDNLGDMC